MNGARVAPWLWFFMLLYAAVVMPRMAAPDAWLYTSVLTTAVVNTIGSLIRLAALTAAWWFTNLATRQFDAGNPVRGAWRLLTWGMALYALGQLGLNVLGWLYDQPPYPSPADVLFLVGTVLLSVALVVFLRSYLGGGLMGSVRAPITVGAVTAVILGAANLMLLRPLLTSGAPALEIAVNLAYPILDAVMVVAAVMVLRIAVRFRGGSIWEVWALLLSGFLCLGAGDILYAYFTAFDMAHLDPVMDLMYTWAYLLLAFGAQLNHRLTRAT